MTDYLKRTINTLNVYAELKKSGMLDVDTVRLLLQSHQKSNPSKEINTLQNVIAISQMFSGPFPKPDQIVDGMIRFAETENLIPVGINPEECHVLIGGQTGSGKSTLLKLIFAQALMLSKGNENV